MRTYRIFSNKYDIALDRLLTRRLEESGCIYALAAAEDGVSVTIRTRASMMALAEALINLICRDLIYFELARRVDELPLMLREKQQVLRDALAEARALEPPEGAREAMLRYLAEAESLNLEGYILFRLRPQLERWDRCLEQAAAEQMLRREYAALLGVIVQRQPPRMRELCICLNADGSCTLSDDSDALLEYIDCSDDGILSLLVGMAPARLTVYDLSGGRMRALADAIMEAFEGRVRLYR
ncbi:MAG: sporulation protein YtxC [Clostridia bacterium]|nr:sporulation protein YtxC [Clostridia bacterium]